MWKRERERCCKIVDRADVLPRRYSSYNGEGMARAISVSVFPDRSRLVNRRKKEIHLRPDPVSGTVQVRYVSFGSFAP